MLVHDHLRATARIRPDKPALIVGDQRFSFAEIDRASDRLAARFQRLGMTRGDRVATLLENSAEFVITLWAAFKAGAVFVPIAHGTHTDRLRFILEDSGARCLVAAPALKGRVSGAASGVELLWAGEDGWADDLGPLSAPRLIDQDLCMILYTSGSTGQPKGVMMTHAAVSNNLTAIASYLGNVPEDVILCVLPVTFNYGLFQILSGAHVGYCVVLEKGFVYPFEVLKRIGEHKVTGMPGVPALFATMLQFAPFDGLDMSSLRYLTNAAAPLPPAHIARLRELLPKATIYSMYGLTECARVSYLDPAQIEPKSASVGQALPNAEIYLVDDMGDRVPPGEVGELVVRGAGLMRGYWRRPRETARALADGGLPGEKVLMTGDLFRMDADGDLFFVGRRDEVFKCKGEKVVPREVENALHELEDVAEAAVIGVPDPVEGMAPKAFVVLRAGSTLTEQAIRRHCRARLDAQMVPKWVVLCDGLPKTPSGKITKSALAAQATE